MKERTTPTTLSLFLWQAWLPVALIALWFAVSAQSDSVYWPPLTTIVGALFDDLADGTLMEALGFSLLNYVAGLAIAIVVGVLIGVVVGNSAALRKVFMPFLDFARASPPVVFVPVFILGLGLGAGPKILLISIGCLWPILLNTIEGVRSIAPSVLEMGRAFRIPFHLRLSSVLIPGALPQIMVGIRISVTVGVTMLIISEMFGSTGGLGFYILQSGANFKIPETWAGTILIGIVGYLLSTLFLVIEHRMLGWYREDASIVSRRKRLATSSL